MSSIVTLKSSTGRTKVISYKLKSNKVITDFRKNSEEDLFRTIRTLKEHFSKFVSFIHELVSVCVILVHELGRLELKCPPGLKVLHIQIHEAPSWIRPGSYLLGHTTSGDEPVGFSTGLQDLGGGWRTIRASCWHEPVSTTVFNHREPA